MLNFKILPYGFPTEEYEAGLRRFFSVGIPMEFLFGKRTSSGIPVEFFIRISKNELMMHSYRILNWIPYGFHTEEYGAGLRRLFFRVNSYRIPVWKNEFQWNSGLEVL